MGYIAHDAIVMTTSDHREGGLPDVDAFRASLPERWRHLVIGPIPSVMNTYASYAFLPDGSKEGWDDSHEGDRYREQFLALFDCTYDDGSSPDDGVAVRYGGDFVHENDHQPAARRVGGLDEERWLNATGQAEPPQAVQEEVVTEGRLKLTGSPRQVRRMLADPMTQDILRRLSGDR